MPLAPNILFSIIRVQQYRGRFVMFEKTQCECVNIKLLEDLNFEYDIEDNVWYALDYGYRVIIRGVDGYFTEFKLYLGGFSDNNFIGSFFTKKSFQKAIKQYNRY